MMKMKTMTMKFAVFVDVSNDSDGFHNHVVMIMMNDSDDGHCKYLDH